MATNWTLGLQTGATSYKAWSVTSSYIEEDDVVQGGSYSSFNLSQFGGSGIVKNDVASLNIKRVYTVLNQATWTLTFDYEITSVNILAKNSDSTTIYRYDDWATLENNTVTIKCNLTQDYDKYYLLVLINKPLSVTGYTYTENLTHITSAGSKPSYKPSENFKITYTANKNYHIESLVSNIGTVSISSDKLNATLSGTATKDITVTGQGATIDYGYVSITGTFLNCTCNYSDGEQISPTKGNITITANEGYIFKGIFNYKSGPITYSFKATSDNKQLYASTIESIDLNDSYIAVREVATIGGFTNIYKTTNTELSNLSKVRFYEDIDYGSYILGCYVLPYKLPDSIIGDTTNIILGKYDSKVTSTSLLDYLVHIDYGSIKVPSKYHNVYDYLDTNCILRIPFFENIHIENQYVIGQTLHIEYIIDLYSGLCGVNVSSTFNNGIAFSATTNIVTQIPFIQRSSDNVINQLSTNLLNSVNECTLEVTHNVRYNPDDNLFGKPTKIIDTLNKYTGYIEVENINLITSATNDEIDEIKKLLKSGIFIN